MDEFLNKKFEDYTLKEIKNICDNHNETCRGCPFALNEFGRCIFENEYPDSWATVVTKLNKI